MGKELVQMNALINGRPENTDWGQLWTWPDIGSLEWRHDINDNYIKANDIKAATSR